MAALPYTASSFLAVLALPFLVSYVGTRVVKVVLLRETAVGGHVPLDLKQEYALTFSAANKAKLEPTLRWLENRVAEYTFGENVGNRIIVRMKRLRNSPAGAIKARLQKKSSISWEIDDFATRMADVNIYLKLFINNRSTNHQHEWGPFDPDSSRFTLKFYGPTLSESELAAVVKKMRVRFIAGTTLICRCQGRLVKKGNVSDVHSFQFSTSTTRQTSGVTTRIPTPKRSNSTHPPGRYRISE